MRKSGKGLSTKASILLVGWFALFVGSGVLAGEQKRALEAGDLFRLNDIVDIQLSPNGREILFVTNKADLDENRYVRTIWRLPREQAPQPIRFSDGDKDYFPRWSPDGKRIAFLSTRDGSAQIWLQDSTTGRREKVTNMADGILSFAWSPDGRQIAFVAKGSGTGTFEEAIENERGVVIDKENFVVYQLLRDQVVLDLEKPSDLWILDTNSHEVKRLTADSNVSRFAWSPDSQTLAVAEEIALGTRVTSAPSSVVLYAVADKNLTVLLRGQGGEDWDNTISYSDPLWSPDGKRLAVLYRDRKDRWSSLPRVGIYSFEDREFSLITTEEELELYEPRFRWIKKDEIYLENTYRGQRHLFSLSTANGAVTPVIFHDPYDSHFSFSADGRKVAFVRQTLQQPPEIYTSHFPFESAAKLSSVNSYLDSIRLPETERVRWTSLDGTEVEGLLFRPPGGERIGPSPLLVFVHGGPGVVQANRFEPYYYQGSVFGWPYPFRLFAQRGYVVFLPNYRGTGSYGKSFRQFREIGKDATEDIISGISWLVKRGIADPNLVGMMGQSHGSWLGAYIMAHNRMFKAASFAEGSVQQISLYGHMSGWLNLNIHEYYYGGSPYDNLERYIDLSPVFHFAGLTTATLLEYGEQSLAVAGLEFLSALWRQGVPHEMVIYPKTGHAISSPVLQLESVQRNLDWFGFWLKGEEDPDPSKAEQYARWRELRRQHEENAKPLDRP